MNGLFEKLQDLSPAVVALVVSTFISLSINIVSIFYSHRLARRRDDRNRRIDKEEQIDERKRSMKLNDDQKKIIQNCVRSGKKKFKALICVPEEVVISVENENTKIYKSNDRSKLIDDLHFMNDKRYIIISSENNDFIYFTLIQQQSDEIK